MPNYCYGTTSSEKQRESCGDPSPLTSLSRLQKFAWCRPTVPKVGGMPDYVKKGTHTDLHQNTLWQFGADLYKRWFGMVLHHAYWC